MNIEKLISELVIEFEKIVPEEENDLIQIYREYIKELINSAKYSSIPQDYKDVEEMLRYELKRFKKMNIDEIKNEIIIDESFERIQSFSRKAFVNALKVLDGEKVESNTIAEIKQELESIEKEMEKVREDNMKEAKKMLSEAILDVQYVEKPFTKLTSLRIGHEIEERRRMNENERD